MTAPWTAERPDAAQTKDGDGGAGFDFGGVEDGADAGGDAAAEETDFFQGGGFVDFGDGDFREYGAFGKGGGAHEVVDGFAAAGEAGVPSGN